MSIETEKSQFEVISPKFVSTSLLDSLVQLYLLHREERSFSETINGKHDGSKQ